MNEAQTRAELIDPVYINTQFDAKQRTFLDFINK